MLIRLRGCAGWSAHLLFAYCINRFSHDAAHIFLSWIQDIIFSVFTYFSIISCTAIVQYSVTSVFPLILMPVCNIAGWCYFFFYFYFIFLHITSLLQACQLKFIAYTKHLQTFLKPWIIKSFVLTCNKFPVLTVNNALLIRYRTKLWFHGIEWAPLVAGMLLSGKKFWCLSPHKIQAEDIDYSNYWMIF